MEHILISGDFPRLEQSAVALGKFDGLHRGHRKLMEAAIRGKEEGEPFVLLSFIMSGNMIFSREERAHLAESLGVDILIECPLEETIRLMEPETFVSRILKDALNASLVVVGSDYRFGRNRKGDTDLLTALGREKGFRTVIVPKETDRGIKISSTGIRKALFEGDMERVSFLLGTPYFIEGTVVHGRGLGHKALLPTINIIPGPNKYLPPAGVYASRVFAGERVYRAMTNIGTNPTVHGDHITVETHILDFSGDLYGTFCRIELLSYLRPEKAFPGLEELKRQLAKDREAVKTYFEKK